MRVVVADDHPAILDALCRALERGDVEIAGRAGDGEQALHLILTAAPDVAVLDVRMPRLDGIAIARRLHEAEVPTAAILYTGAAERAVLLEALDAGARGFVRKEAPLTDVEKAIRVVASGETYVDPALEGVLTSCDATQRLPALSPREREILRLLADGMGNEQVAQRLEISPLTVRTHVKNAMLTLEADTRTQAVARALRDSLIS